MSLLKFLKARTKAESDAHKETAYEELSSVFLPARWGIEIGVSEYSTNNKLNLWNNELRKRVRRAIEKTGSGLADYSNWLQEIHYTIVGIYYKEVFQTHKENIGWRVAIIAVPAARVIAIGLASHYQGGQQHNKLGQASNLLRDAAKDGLEASGTGLILSGRYVTPEDWDRDGLIPHTISSIAGVDLTNMVGIPNLILKDVRTTTVKKTIASYITIDPQGISLKGQSLLEKLQDLQLVGELLAGIYPFRTTSEFEPIRSLALQDTAAATLRLQLRQKSSTRSTVLIFYGPPGTGKTLTAVREAVKLADSAFDNSSEPEAAFGRFNELGDQLAFITFHQALQYEDVIESIRPELSRSTTQEADDDEGDADKQGRSRFDDGLAYRIHEGLFLRMIRKAAREPNKEFVIVIDEINRGDVSRILGPLISALDPDKRVGAEFPIGVELQYPKAEKLESRLYLPPNIHFIGTMNSSDRNIALVDYALRRRFEFVLCPPEPMLLGATTDSDPIDMKQLLETLNRRIEHLLDADYCIGHGYFMACRTNSDVIEVFSRKIVPLLVEYFYGNAGLMLLILGDIPGGKHNIFKVKEPESSFKNIFNVDRTIAARLGYRTHDLTLGFRLDPRFWDHSRPIPGPRDEAHACRAIRKIYETAVSATLSDHD